MILFIKHIGIEGPGTAGDFFQKAVPHLQTIELQDGDSLPHDLSQVDAVISLGGPMNVYEEKAYPFLEKENFFLKKVIKKNIPLLGVCLGSQLIAKAAGAKVFKAPEKEIGFSEVLLTDEGQKDPLFEGIDPSLCVFQWHEDTFDIPKEGILLAKSSECVHQAFRVGPCAYGLQFHVEITDQAINDWSDAYFESNNPELLSKRNEMLGEYLIKKDRFNCQAQQIYKNFLKLISSLKVAV